jgi:CheY-like chemotaxis protein
MWAPEITAATEPEEALTPPPVPDDRYELKNGEPLLLIVDNDEAFASYVLDLARELGFRGIVATRGASAVALAREFRPSAITLDIRLPDVDGWRILDRLKNDPETRHIPIYVISSADDVLRGIRRGAKGLLRKPIENRDELERLLSEIRRQLQTAERRILVIARDGAAGDALDRLPAEGFERIIIPPENALEALGDCQLDLVIVALDDESTPADVLEALVRRCEEQRTPVLVYQPREVPASVAAVVERLGQTSVLAAASTPAQLADQASLFLHLPRSSQDRRTTTLAGRKALIVDDDIRNIFALTSILERHHMAVLSAETGQEAIELLARSPDVDIVLMDIMMPGMDGYETMRQIRRVPHFRELPIVAVTAKAMKGDREKTIEAGAWDYLAKPIDTQQLVTVLEAWLC